MSAIGTEINFGLELDPKTAVLLTKFARRRRRLLMFRAFAAGLLFLIVSMIAVAVCDYFWVTSEPLRWLLSLLARCLLVAGTRYVQDETLPAVSSTGGLHLFSGSPQS